MLASDTFAMGSVALHEGITFGRKPVRCEVAGFIGSGNSADSDKNLLDRMYRKFARTPVDLKTVTLEPFHPRASAPALVCGNYSHHGRYLIHVGPGEE